MPRSIEGHGRVSASNPPPTSTFSPASVRISAAMPGRGRDAEPGTIRGDLGVSRSYNLIHGSDSTAAAEREITLFFDADEIVEWQPAGHKWVYDAEDLG